MNFTKLVLAASVITPLLFVTCTVTAGDNHEHDHHHSDEHRQHDSHMHGIATINMALEGDEVHIELDSPAVNIVGFEHAPSSDADHAALEKAVALLKDGDKLFEFNESAECKLEKAEVESVMLSACRTTPLQPQIPKQSAAHFLPSQSNPIIGSTPHPV